MKPVRAIILGYGIRGRAYAAYADAHPEDFALAGLADPVPPVLTRSHSGTAAPPVWRSWEEALAADVQADAVIVALPDKLHLPATLAALKKGYHVLLEKPIGCSWAECEQIRDAQRAAGRLVLTGYVLRYSPFYKELRKVVASGVIGDLTSIRHLVAISYGKASHAFCRGNWAVEAEGTGMLVNKCTHDFDLIAWWTKGRPCRRLSSFGSLLHWRPENAPLGAAARCSDCAPLTRETCPFDAEKLYFERPDLRYHFSDTSDAAMRAVVSSSRYGRCVYHCGNDSVDHQSVLMDYAGGLTVILEMESYTNVRERLTHFFGTRGEILADEKTIEIKPFFGAPRTLALPHLAHHGGGDSAIMAAFVKLVKSGTPARFSAILDDALVSHRLAFLAEQSRYTGQTILYKS